MMKKALRAGHLHAQASAFEATEAAASDSSFFDLPILPDFRVESPSYEAGTGPSRHFRLFPAPEWCNAVSILPVKLH
jgi:hypothetical protein